jgi:enoyl-CoA hydratase
MSDTVATEVQGRVLVIRLQREHKRNAVDPDTTMALSEAFDRLDDDPEIWAGVLTGTTTVFSAGTDMSTGGSRTERGGPYGLVRRQRLKPVVAAVEGPALGGGFEIVLSCDLVVASREARFGLPEVKRGLIPNCAGIYRAPRALPRNIANEMLLTGDPISAERAEHLGLVNLVTEPGQALPAALDLAGRICANGPVAVREVMRVMGAVLADEEEVGWQATEAGQDVIQSSADAAEGKQAFFDKREPRWTGR